MEKCKYCDSEELYEEPKPPHIGLYCGECGRFQKWVKQDKPIETGEAASEAQQKYAVALLEKWKRKNTVLTARQAGAIIQAFKD